MKNFKEIHDGLGYCLKVSNGITLKAQTLEDYNFQKKLLTLNGYTQNNTWEQGDRFVVKGEGATRTIQAVGPKFSLVDGSQFQNSIIDKFVEEGDWIKIR